MNRAVEDSYESSDDNDNSVAEQHSHTNENMDALNRIADAISKEQPRVVSPSPPQFDDIDAFLIGIGIHLRRLPENVRLETMMEMLKIVYNTCQQYVY